MVDLGEEVGVSWLEIALIIAALAGVFAGAALIAQRPSFWLGIGTAMAKAGVPYLITYITRRLSPEKEAEMRACLRRGGEWDPIRKRCKK